MCWVCLFFFSSSSEGFLLTSFILGIYWDTSNATKKQISFHATLFEVGEGENTLHVKTALQVRNPLLKTWGVKSNPLYLGKGMSFTQHGGTLTPAEPPCGAGKAISSCRQWQLSTAAPTDRWKWKHQACPELPASLQCAPEGSQECEAGPQLEPTRLMLGRGQCCGKPQAARGECSYLQKILYPGSRSVSCLE